MGQAELFGDRMTYLVNDRNKPFINYGPTILSQNIHSTKCSLLIYSTDNDELKTLRAQIDKYPYDTNFGELPELPVKGDQRGLDKSSISKNFETTTNTSMKAKKRKILNI